ARTATPPRSAVELHPAQHSGIVGRRSSPFPIAGINRAQLEHVVDQLVNEPSQVTRRQPLAQVRRQQQDLVGVVGPKGLLGSSSKRLAVGRLIPLRRGSNRLRQVRDLHLIGGSVWLWHSRLPRRGLGRSQG